MVLKTRNGEAIVEKDGNEQGKTGQGLDQYEDNHQRIITLGPGFKLHLLGGFCTPIISVPASLRGK